MGEELASVASRLRDYLVTVHHVSDIRGPISLSADWRSWDIRFLHRGLQRHYIYRVDRVDSEPTMYRALRADTNGELLVRVPTGEGVTLFTNDIYYPPHG